MTAPRLSRRTVLRGLGATIALPLLDQMHIVPAWAAAGGTPKSPTRMAFMYIPNGAHMADWTPTEEGKKFDLPETLKLLEPHRKEMLVLTGLAQHHAAANGDGPGDHARAMSTFLTGMQAKKTSGSDIKVGVSVDQVAAERLRNATRFASLEIGCDAGKQSGECDSGYSCAYSNNLAWKDASTPVAKEINPRAVFDRLFGHSDSSNAQREKLRQSILDTAMEDAKDLRGKLGAGDQRKLDEYLTAVREIETRLNRTEKKPAIDLSKVKAPSGVPSDYAEHIRLMGDMMVLAFQTDMTRVCTFVIANEGSNRNYRFIDVPEGHHELSHHEKKVEKQAKIAKINRFHMEQFAYVIGKLKATKDGDGTLLDHSMIAYGGGIGDGNRHNHNDLPIVLLGGGNGTIKPGRHIRYPKDTPLNNLWLSMLDRMDAHTDKLGDSTGHLTGLDG